MSKEIAIGVDIGGSHISCAAYDLTNKKLIENTLSESDLDNHAPADEIIKAWGDTIKETISKVGVENLAGIGFAMPGPFEYDKGISRLSGQNGKYENTYGLDVPVELRKYLNLPADFKVRFINDATAFAIGEDQVGKAMDFDHSLSVTLGTGFGSAFIAEGLPVVEGDSVPDQGCVWHLPFEGGIADDYFSTRGFIKRWNDRTGKEISGVKDVAIIAPENAEAAALFTEFGEKMGAFLKPWIVKFGMEAFVIGGNISRAYHLYKDALNGYLEKEGLNLQVFISELKEDAALIGSATLIDDSFYKKVEPVLSKM